MAYRLFYFGCCMAETATFSEVEYQVYRWYRNALVHQTHDEITAGWRGSVYAVYQERIIGVDTLIQSARRVHKEETDFINPRGRVVSHTRKYRGGGGYYRKIGTTAENRMNQCIDPDDIPARSSRRKLPDSWDDFIRHNQRCWKKQHRGMKAWDR